MAAYPKPTNNTGTFNNQNFVNPDTGGLTVDEAKKYFVTFPNTQSPSTIIANNFNTTGSLNVAGDSQFGGDVTFIGGVSISGGITFEDDVEVTGTTTLDDNLLCLTTATVTELLTCEGGIDITTLGDGITFPDNTTQTTAFIEANYAQLNTDNIFLAPYKQTFQQNNSTVPSTASLQINNIQNSDNVAFYIDPSAGNDLTLYSSQSGGGLTVRNPTASFTLNPIVISPGVVGAQSLNTIDMNAQNITGIGALAGNGGNIVCNANLLMGTGVNLNMQTNTITNCSALNGVSGGTLLLGTQQPVYVSISGGSLTAGSSLGINSTNGTFVFNYYFANNLSLNMSGTAQTFFIQNANGSIMSFSETEIDASKNLNMNSQNIIGCNSITDVTGQYVTTNTPPNNTIPTAIATTGYVQTAITAIAPVYTASSFTLTTPTSASMTMNPSTVSTLTTYTAGNNTVTFNSNLFTLTTVVGGLFTLLQITFSVAPFPSYPPANINSSMTVYCVNNSTTYTSPIVWLSPAAMYITYPTGAPNTAGITFNLNLATIGAFTA